MNNKTLIIKADKSLLSVDLKELWDYRELLYFLVWRDVKIRYKQTYIGILWAIIQPLFTMIVFTIFFGRIAKIPSEGVPYPIFSYSGLLLWIYFSQAMSNSSNSLVGNTNLISKVYFPRIIVPLSSSLSGIFDYFIAVSILILMMFYYGIYPGISILLLPFVLLMTFIVSTGFGLWLSSLNVKYRDIRYALPFAIQLMLFITPVIYPTDFIPEKFRWIMYLNPMSGLIDTHRACFLDYRTINWEQLIISSLIGLLIFVSGLYYFKKTERFFADYI